MCYFHTSNKREQTIATRNDIDFKKSMLSETSQTEKDKYCMIHLYVESKNKDLMDIEKRLVVA